MLLQFCQLLEAFRTVAAAVRSLLRVTEHVYFKVSSPGAGLATLFAFKRLLPRMDKLVLLQSALSPKLFPAHLAAVRFLSRVGEDVLPEGVQQVEALVALRAGVTSLSWSLFRYSFSLAIFIVLCVNAHMQS